MLETTNLAIITWTGDYGRVERHNARKGPIAALEPLLEIFAQGVEELITATHTGILVWLAPRGLVRPGDPIARIMADKPVWESKPRTSVEIARMPTQPIRPPYAMSTEVNPHPYKVTSEESAFIREFAKANGLAVGDALRIALYGLATMPQGEQEQLIRRFREALGA